MLKDVEMGDGQSEGVSEGRCNMVKSIGWCMIGYRSSKSDECIRLVLAKDSTAATQGRSGPDDNDDEVSQNNGGRCSSRG